MTATLRAVSFLFGKQKYAQGKVGTVDFDTIISEEHKFSSRVTNFPLENGSYASDHIINEPDVVVLKGLVSDTPLPFTGRDYLNILNILSSGSRSVAAFNDLVRIQQNKEIVKVVTGLKVYDSMAITSLNVPRDTSSGQALVFTIELQRIIFLNAIQRNPTIGNLSRGIAPNIPSATVSTNDSKPSLRTDPPNSLKDQASSVIDAGEQKLQTVESPSVEQSAETIWQVIQRAILGQLF